MPLWDKIKAVKVWKSKRHFAIWPLYSIPKPVVFLDNYFYLIFRTVTAGIPNSFIDFLQSNPMKNYHHQNDRITEGRGGFVSRSQRETCRVWASLGAESPGEYLNLIGALLAFTACHLRLKLASSICGSLPWERTHKTWKRKTSLPPGSKLVWRASDEAH